MSAPRGPIPKRESERRRRNKTDESGNSTEAEVIDLTEITGEPDSIPWRIRQPISESLLEPDSSWHEIAKDMFDSLTRSGQAIYYEPSDWALARLLCESLSRDLEKQVVGITETGEVVRAEIPLKGASLNSYLKGFAQLAVSEGERRRLRIELEGRYKIKKPGAVVPVGEQRKQHLS